MVYRNWAVVVDLQLHLNDHHIPNRDGGTDLIYLRIHARARHDLPYFGILRLTDDYSLALLDIIMSVNGTPRALSNVTTEDLLATFSWTQMNATRARYTPGQTDYNLCFTFDQTRAFYHNIFVTNVLNVVAEYVDSEFIPSD